MNLTEFQLPPVLADDRASRALGSALADRRDGYVYVHAHDSRIMLAVRVAIATRRPLLLRGDPGSGKSSLAPFIARGLNWRYYSQTVGARTQARDLMWGFDALRRLSDAQSGTPEAMKRVEGLENYIEPRALWWAINPGTAQRRGLPASLSPDFFATDKGIEPLQTRPGAANSAGVVVLIDEIDKAEPDMPNNLLECLGSLQFAVDETGFTVSPDDDLRLGRREAPLIIITTNEERELPNAFQRRCVSLFLKRHDKNTLIEIAKAHFPAGADGQMRPAAREETFGFIADELKRFQSEARKSRLREPSTAEYLDAVRACLTLAPDPVQRAAMWAEISALTLVKQKPPESGDEGKG